MVIGTSTGPGGDQRIDANPTTERGRTRMSTVTESAPGTMASRVSRSRDASAAMSAAGRAERRVAADTAASAAQRAVIAVAVWTSTVSRRKVAARSEKH